ncbi:MAG: polysaccharide biosynthesis protein [Flavobacterium sp.]|jgi:FlaA1/EpsC-like NDP-sugar epimerase|nr:polysaccharide biosynthesis protein [Flavobacterium sp.]
MLLNKNSKFLHTYISRLKNFSHRKLELYSSKWLVLTIDIFIINISFVLSYLLIEESSSNSDMSILGYYLPLISLIGLSSFLVVGSYKGIIRHTSARDSFNVLVATTLLSSLLLFLVFTIKLFGILESIRIEVSVIIIHYLLNVFILINSRYAFKSFFRFITIKSVNTTNVLIYGAGQSGLIVYGALKRDTKNNYKVIGFLDDDIVKIGKKIDQVKILNPQNITSSFIEKHRINEVVISIQNISPPELLKISDSYIKTNLEVKIVPPLKSWVDGIIKVNQIKKVKITDLLGRIPIKIENSIIKREISGKRILITGAAGSIGSEITRQLSKYKYDQLILIDQAESPLYDLQQELIQNNKHHIIPVVAGIQDRSKMEELFETYRPHKVYHAAAYKHVPLMEYNPYEAIKTNILGTKTLADISVKYSVESFVMISTDKAVNPTNIMGATKRTAELYISCLSNQNNNTKFTTTRFGNVLGSNGSVIPLFEKQIQKRLPLTVTHKDITRYFMTIPEACNLVLEAGTMGEGGEIYIFDMGKSVKIFDIAKKMIYLSGLKYPEDIDIKISGLRPGEKLYEELLANGENTIPTHHKKIMIAKLKDIDCDFTSTIIEELSRENQFMTDYERVSLLKKIVPEYVSKNSIHEKLDKIFI